MGMGMLTCSYSAMYVVAYNFKETMETLLAKSILDVKVDPLLNKA